MAGNQTTRLVCSRNIKETNKQATDLCLWLTFAAAAAAAEWIFIVLPSSRMARDHTYEMSHEFSRGRELNAFNSKEQS
jgi:hypothetical protein